MFTLAAQPDPPAPLGELPVDALGRRFGELDGHGSFYRQQGSEPDFLLKAKIGV